MIPIYCPAGNGYNIDCNLCKVLRLAPAVWGLSSISCCLPSPMPGQANDYAKNIHDLYFPTWRSLKSSNVMPFCPKGTTDFEKDV